MLAVAVNPVPPSVEVMALVVLVILPGAEPVTFTVIVHVPLIAKFPPASEIAAVPGRAVTTPPQVLMRPLGLDTNRPAGSGSRKVTPLSAVVALGLAMLNVSVVTPLSGSTATPNALLMVGGRATMVLAAAVLPLPPSTDPITEVTLFFTPAEVPVTVTVTVQVPLAGMVPPVRLMEVAAGAAVRVPPQVFDCTTGLATTMPVGSASVKFAPVKAMVFVLVSVKLKVVLVLMGNTDSANDLLMDGGVATTKVAVAALPLTPSVDPGSTAATLLVMLFFTPLVEPSTLTVRVHVPLPASVTFNRETDVPPVVAVAVPPQVLLNPLGVATSNPVGRVSVNCRLIN